MGKLLREKSDTFNSFEALFVTVVLEKNDHLKKAVRIRSDHGKEFENSLFSELCNKHGITHEFSTPKAHQQNGVVERKNRTLQEMARVMLKVNNIPVKF